jgi:hypothetical protein
LLIIRTRVDDLRKICMTVDLAGSEGGREVRQGS